MTCIFWILWASVQSGFSREIELIGYTHTHTHTHTKIYYEILTHMIVDTEKSHSLAICKLETQENQWYSWKT